MFDFLRKKPSIRYDGKPLSNDYVELSQLTMPTRITPKLDPKPIINTVHVSTNGIRSSSHVRLSRDLIDVLRMKKGTMSFNDYIKSLVSNA